MDFGQRIRYLREKRGMTQDELAHKKQKFRISFL